MEKEGELEVKAKTKKKMKRNKRFHIVEKHEAIDVKHENDVKDDAEEEEPPKYG